MSHRSHGNRSSESPHIWKALRCKKGKSWNQLNCLWTALFGMATNEWYFFVVVFKKQKTNKQTETFYMDPKMPCGTVWLSRSTYQNQQIIKRCLHGKKTISPHASQTRRNLNWVCSQESSEEQTYFEVCTLWLSWENGKVLIFKILPSRFNSTGPLVLVTWQAEARGSFQFKSKLKASFSKSKIHLGGGVGGLSLQHSPSFAKQLHYKQCTHWPSGARREEEAAMAATVIHKNTPSPIRHSC